MSTQFTEQDRETMQRVLDLAARGSSTTQPNPRVGCVLVNDGRIVGEGFHHMAGELHAEREALKQAGEAARGATAYVNLEPCCHQGRTPPCTDGLIDAGVTRVIGAMRDPNPLVAGGGYEQLQMAGIEVASGLLEGEARWLNRGFISRMQTGRPWVHLKMAATLDGRTADVNGESKWISCDSARDQVQRMRAESSAVMTGIGTILADDASLNVRTEGAERQPLRVVLDTDLRIPLDAKVIGENEGLMVFTCSQDHEKISALTERGVEVIELNGALIDLQEVCRELAEWQCNEVLIEAGSTLAGALLETDLVDEMTLFYGGSVLGHTGRAMFATAQAIEFAERPHFDLREAEVVGESVVINSVKPNSLQRLMGKAPDSEAS